MSSATVAFSTHRPEVLPFAETLMDRHDVVVLEEPPVSGFTEMLEEITDIDDYILGTETEYPEFARQSCRLWRRLKRAGKTIYQIEPYLEILSGIHDFFADGGKPDDISPATDRHAVYQCEKAATGHLLAYYHAVMGGDFNQTVEAVLRFARVDARRFVLRDRMRADMLLPHLSGPGRLYIEAGEMHAMLWRQLLRRKPPYAHLQRVYLMAPVLPPLAGKPRIFSPGDQLTLRCLFRGAPGSGRDVLLAAQALVYNKILQKAEMPGEDYPHTRNEIDTIKTVRRLSFDDCRLLFRQIRFRQTAEARAIVDGYLKRPAI